MKMKKYLALALFGLVALTSCGGEEPTDTNSSTTTQTVTTPDTISTVSDFSNAIKNGLKDVFTVTTNAVMKDGETIVYKNDTKITITNSETLSGSSVVDRYSLNQNFKLEKKTKTTYFENLDSNNLFGYNLDDSYFVTKTVDENSLVGTIKPESAQAFFNSTSVDVSEPISVSFVLNNKKLYSITINYKSLDKDVSVSSLKDVSVSSLYTYK